MAHRVAQLAERDLDDIWYYVANESNTGLADQLIDALTDRFVLLAGFPYLGRSREVDFGFDCRSFPVGDYVIVYCVEGEDVFILRVVHGRRDIDALFP